MSDRARDESGVRQGASADIDNQMKALRSRIDKLDEQLVKLLNERAECALGLGRLKEQVGLETYQPNREIEVLDHARQVNQGPLEGGAITRLFERIIDENRRLERLAEDND